ncbi:MAG: hypothetical protein ACYTEQ_18255 [Planctomycetota bacterium]|jgi:hypothetical protein
MTTISINPKWHTNVNVEAMCRPYTIDIDGSARRMGTRSKALVRVGEATGHCLARTALVHFHRAIPAEYRPAQANTIDPLYFWNKQDYFRNGRQYRTMALGSPRTGADGATNAYLATGSSETVRITQNVAANYWENPILMRYDVDRGDEANALVNSTIDAYGSLYPIDVVVQDFVLTELSTSNHTTVDTSQVKAGRKVLSGQASSVAEAHLQLKNATYPLAFSWHATGTAAGWATTTSPGDTRGMRVSSADDGVNQRVNLLDHAYTARNADTPGFQVHCEKAGWGYEGSAAGQRVSVDVAVYANCSADSNALVILETSDANVALNVTAADPTIVYVGTDSEAGALYLNAAVADSETGATRNKIDAFGQVNSGAMDIFFVRGWLKPT